MHSRPEEPYTLPDLVKKTGSREEDVKSELLQLLDDDKIKDLKNGEYISSYGLDVMVGKMSSPWRNITSGSALGRVPQG
jgi:hypothetical protein